MIDPGQFMALLDRLGLSFYAGIPDSVLREFCDELEQRKIAHVCANEGNAVAMLAGYHLATGGIGVGYMQNSGLGNAFNPLMSLTHPEIYAIPMLLLVGWRGEPGRSDEPQHVAQGKATPATLLTLGIEHIILPDTLTGAESALSEALVTMKAASAPYAVLIRKGTFDTVNRSEPASPPGDLMSREEALGRIVELFAPETRFVATTGMLSRELFELRERNSQSHASDFLTVGSMGHASSIALGLALSRPVRPVVCLDGDGAALMHMGAMAVIGNESPSNLYHVVFNNCAHDSVGGQATAGCAVDLSGIARACGYRSAQRVEFARELKPAVESMFAGPGPGFLDVRVAPGARPDLGRPTRTPKENKSDFMNGLS